MARNIIDYVVFDRDTHRIVDFRLSVGRTDLLLLVHHSISMILRKIKTPLENLQEVFTNLAPTGFQHTSLPSLKASVCALLGILSPTSNSYSTPVNYLKNEKTDRNWNYPDKMECRVVSEVQ